MDVILNDGIVTEYDDFYLWVKELDLDADARLIRKDEDEEAVSVTSAKVKKIIDHSDFGSEDEYNDAVDDLNSEDFDACAEFVTDEGIFYVGVECADDESDVDSFEIGDGTYYC